MSRRRTGAYRALAACAAGALLLARPLAGSAEEGAEAAAVRDLGTLTVTADDVIGAGPTSAYRLSEQQIEDFAGASGNLTDALRMIPGVQFGEDALGEDRLFDLRPSSVSISGGRFYENSFLLNGASFSSGLDPLADNSSAIDSVPGHEQALFIDLDTVGSITVYESNVPASFGRFTGGVVDVESKRPSARAGGSWHYSATRDDWVNYRVLVRDDVDPDDPPEPTGFKRERMGLSWEQPFGRVLSRISLVRNASETPVVVLGEPLSNKRLNHNIAAAVAAPMKDGFVDLDLSYAPYESEQYLNNTKNGRYSIHGGGAAFSAGFESAGGSRHIDFALSFSENRREAADEFYSWRNTPSRSWGIDNGLSSSSEGGFGDLDRRQSGVSLRWREAHPAVAAAGRIGFEYGADAGLQRLEESRAVDHYIYDDALVNTAIQCRGITRDCVQNEQYFFHREIREAGFAEVELLQLSLFGETSYENGPLSLTVGLRYDHDDFLKNHDIAPRLRGAYDLSRRGTSVLVFGANRYYGAPLLTYRLREARKPYRSEFRGVTMNIVNDWVPDSDIGPLRYVFDDLRTPYADEGMLGLKQRLYGGMLEFKLVAREGRQEMASVTTPTQSDGYRWVVMNNDGRSRYRGVSLAWFRSLSRVDLGAHVSWSETRTSNADFDTEAENPSLSGDAIYRGQRIPMSRLTILRADYNRPVIAGLSAAWQVTGALRTSLLLNYRGRFDGVVESGRTFSGGLVTLPDGSLVEDRLAEYIDSEHAASLLADLRLAWRFGSTPSVTLEAHVNNLFDARTYSVSEQESGVELGRYYWAGLSGTF